MSLLITKKFVTIIAAAGTIVGICYLTQFPTIATNTWNSLTSKNVQNASAERTETTNIKKIKNQINLQETETKKTAEKIEILHINKTKKEQNITIAKIQIENYNDQVQDSSNKIKENVQKLSTLNVDLTTTKEIQTTKMQESIKLSKNITDKSLVVNKSFIDSLSANQQQLEEITEAFKSTQLTYTKEELEEQAANIQIKNEAADKASEQLKEMNNKIDTKKSEISNLYNSYNNRTDKTSDNAKLEESEIRKLEAELQDDTYEYTKKLSETQQESRQNALAFTKYQNGLEELNTYTKLKTQIQELTDDCKNKQEEINTLNELKQQLKIEKNSLIANTLKANDLSLKISATESNKKSLETKLKKAEEKLTEQLDLLIQNELEKEEIESILSTEIVTKTEKTQTILNLEAQLD